MMKRKYSYYSYMAAAAMAAMLTGCNGGQESPVETDKKVTAPGETKFKIAVSFKTKCRINEGTEQKKYTPEELEYHAEFGRKLEQDIRNNMVWKGKFAEANKALESMLEDKKVSPELHGKALLLRIDSAMRAKNYADVVAVAEKYRGGNWLRSENLLKKRLTNSDEAAVLRQKANALDKLKKYEDKAETLFCRLLYIDPADSDAFNTKREIISSYDKAGKKQDAIRLANELAEMTSGEQQAVALDMLSGLYRTTGQLEKALETLAKLDAVQQDKNKVASARKRIAQSFASAKKFDDATKLYMVTLNDKNVKPETVVDTFFDYARMVKNWRVNKEYSNVQKIAGEKVFSIKDLDAALYGKAATELIVFCSSNLNDKTAAGKYAASILAYPKMPFNYKIDAVKTLTAQDAEKGNFLNAEKMILALFADENCKQNNYVKVCALYAKLLSWQGKCDEAVKFLRSKSTSEFYKNQLTAIIADTYLYFNRYDDAAAVWKEAGNPGKMVSVYREIDTPKARTMAEKILRDQSQPEKLRGEMLTYFLSTRDEDAAIRKEFSGLMKYVNPGRAMQDAVSAAKWDVVLEFYEVMKQNGYAISQDQAKDLVQTYAATGKFDDLLKFVETEKIFSLDNEVSRLKVQERIAAVFAAKVLKNVPSQKGAFKKYFADWKSPAAMTEKEKADMLLYTASLALSAKQNVLAQDIYDTYTALFKAEPGKTYSVKFVDTPIIGIRDFMNLKAAPEIQLMDRKYGGNMDFLVTDVATGNRGSVGTADGKEQQKPTEMQIACDERGVHFFFNAYDSKAKDAEAGIAGMGSYEMYLSPGVNQPYLCILPDLTTGQTNSVWNSSYKTAQWRPIKAKAGQTDIHTEQIFHENGYQVYMRISWEKFYDKLPENGKTWDFENIHWSRFGGSTWNGLKTIHGRSTWGKLTFDISEDQMVQIKKRIIFAARKAYLKEKATNGHYHGAVDRMKNDLHLGDPEFYKTSVAPVIEKLDSYLPLVKTDMDAETVNKIFNEAVPGWFEIPFIISDLHRRYLEDQLTK